MAVNVGTARGYLDLDTSRFTSALTRANATASTQMNKISSTFSTGLKAVGEGMTKIGGFATAGITMPIVTAVTTSVKQFAKLEQSIGGVETLFKKSAPRVIKNSKTAYKRAGIDANKYLEQVTSFSATLLQGLGGDTEKAAKYADKAIVDMSDNANKMGTDIGLIQNAYQGFAKDNYTMLDNLKLGYGGTQSEAARLINDSGVLNGKFKATAKNVKDIPFNVLIDAIHRTQERLGITGTTAKEAQETVSGSFEMMKASVLNFLQQLGNPGADMDKFAQEMIQSIGVFVDNIKRVLGTIWDNLPISPLQKKLIAAAAAFGPVMLAGGKVVSTVGNITGALGKAIPLVSQFASGFASAGAPLAEGASSMTAFGAAIGGIAAPVVAIVAVIAILVAAFVTLWKTNEDFRNKMTGIWNGIKAKFEAFGQGIVERLNALGFDFQNFAEVAGAVWKGFCDLLAPLFEGVFNQISIILGTVLDLMLGIFDIFVGLFTGNWKQAWTGVKGIFSAIWKLIAGTFESWAIAFRGVTDTILGWFGTNWKSVWTAVSKFFTNIWNGIKSFFSAVMNTIKTTATTVWTAISTFFKTIWDAIKRVFTTVVNAIKSFLSSAWNAIKTTITTVFTAIKTTVTTIWNAIKTTITNVVNAIKTTISTVFNAIKTTITTVLNAISTFIKTIWNTIKTTVTNVVDSIKSKISTVFTAIKTTITTIMNAVSSSITTIWNSIKSTVTNVVNGIKSTVSTVFNNMKSAVTTTINTLKTTITNVFNGIKSAISGAMESAKSSATTAMTNAKNGVVNVWKGIKSTFTEIGKNIIQGIIDGIKGMVDSLYDSIKKALSGLVDKAKDALGIKSPSKVFKKEVGSWIPPGIAEGVEDEMGDATKDIQKSIDENLSKVDAEVDPAVSVNDNVSNIVTSFQAAYDGLVGWFESIEERIDTSINNMREQLAALIDQGQLVVNGVETIDYIGYNGSIATKTGRQPSNVSTTDASQRTYVFYSPKAIDEIEAAKQIKKTERDIAEGFM